MRMVRSFFNIGFLSNIFFLFFLHIGCFFFFSSHDSRRPPPKYQQTSPPPPNKTARKVSPVLSASPSATQSPDLKQRCKSLSHTIKSSLNRLPSFRSKPSHGQPQDHQNPPAPPVTPPSPLPPIPLSPVSSAGKTPSWSDEKLHNLSSSPIVPTKQPSFGSRTDIHPCPACGEVLSKSHLLDLHQATKHALSELYDGESGKNIVNIIFHSGWRGKTAIVHRILKIHNTPRTLARFEDYRESVKSKAARNSGRRAGAEDERCVADGNERLRFYCSTILCAMGRDGRASPRPLGVCGSQFCSTCAIVRHGFSGKQANLEGIATHGTSWNAHASLPEDLEEEFAFLRVRRAMLVCRVVAGRVSGGGGAGVEEEEKGVYDSVVSVGQGGGVRSSFGGEEELLVFNPRAVLPCFVIIYSASSPP